jgi:hypothetical protein
MTFYFFQLASLVIEYNSFFNFSIVRPHLPLTTTLTALQELAKEIQRQDLSQKMPFKNK